ncbi:hypothetical protein [Winogradskyella wichelsiae]|uniref:hypothetical protein n=1 Tax=Winogradskyella wichelsiae TaxID=2697007 RepID=UPI0015C92EE8|nr:hypothetical protein [Winogradskyella wichelsiae]
MKKIILLILLISFSLSSFAQRYRSYEDWTLSFGVDAINNLASRSPFEKPGDWNFGTPISAAIEYSWIENFAIEQSITINSFTGDPNIDNIFPEKDYNYLSLDTHAKYYFKELIFGRGRNMSWFNIYADAGLGYFHIDKGNVSANIGAGVLFWLDRNQTIGIRAQTIAKFTGFSTSEVGYDNNHYQYHLQAVIRL